MPRIKRPMNWPCRRLASCEVMLPVVGERFGEVGRQWQRGALFVVEFGQLLAECLQTLRFTLARGFARFLFAHRINVSRISGR